MASLPPLYYHLPYHHYQHLFPDSFSIIYLFNLIKIFLIPLMWRVKVFSIRCCLLLYFFSISFTLLLLLFLLFVSRFLWFCIIYYSLLLSLLLLVLLLPLQFLIVSAPLCLLQQQLNLKHYIVATFAICFEQKAQYFRLAAGKLSNTPALFPPSSPHRFQLQTKFFTLFLWNPPTNWRFSIFFPLNLRTKVKSVWLSKSTNERAVLADWRFQAKWNAYAW